MLAKRRFQFLSENRLLDVHDLARVLHTSPRGVYARVHRGTAPTPIRIGASLRWAPEAVADWLARCERGDA